MTDVAELQERGTGVRVARVFSCDDEFIVLLDYHGASHACLWDNLRRVRQNGDVVWAVGTPNSSDIFTEVDWRDGRLTAWTWECSVMTLDPETGRILERAFMK